MRLDGFSDVSEILRSGVYALAYKGEVVYVGKAKCMLVRAYTHRSQWASKRRARDQRASWIPIKAILYDAVFLRPCPLEQLDLLEQEMIRKYNPKHNVHHRTDEKITVPIEVVINGVALTLNPKVSPTLIERRL